MSTLRLTVNTESEGWFRVSARLERTSHSPLEATGRFKFNSSERDRADLRWYLEDFAEFPFGPDLEIAAHVEQRMGQLGGELWQAIFGTAGPAAEHWRAIHGQLDRTRVEIAADLDASLLPWELLRDPTLGVHLATSTRAFVRIEPIAASDAQSALLESPVRVLLVISRPRGMADVPYRSVARHLFAALASRPDRVQVSVLRPPTFTALQRRLRDAQHRGEPYHIVHFDGHGGYIASSGSDQPVDGRGFLVFELPGSPDNEERIDGVTIGTLLVETQVPLLILNACRSAFAEAVAAPEPVSGQSADAQIRAFTSLAQDVTAAGVAGVVAMRYVVYVATAVEFMATLYGFLNQGWALGEAVTRARKHLHDDLSGGSSDARAGIQDWSVPVVYEAGPLRLLAFADGAIDAPNTSEAGAALSASEELIQHLPPQPNTSFIGRDDVVLAVDRTFDTANVALLHGYAGSGKSAAAGEFGRWYAQSGGVSVPVIFSSFDRPRALPQVLDDFELILRPLIQAIGVEWPALADNQRLAVVLQLLQHVPVLWIWDNAEEIAGFPAPRDTSLLPLQQRDLAEFLRAATGTQGRFLLTSRREEHDWLHEVPVRIALPGMSLRDSVELARAIAGESGNALEDIEPWVPLLQYARGNPLTIRVLVGQALRDGSKSAEALDAFLSRVQSGEAEFDDEESEGRSRSLGAALGYGFAHAFSDEEREHLALLHLFQGYVSVEQLMWLGHPEAEWSVPSLRQLGPADLASLLDRAAAIGFLTRVAPGLYEVHPALPWYLNRLFRQHYPETATRPAQLTAEGAANAYVRAMAEWGNFWHSIYESHTGVDHQFITGEANLLWAWRFAQRNNLSDLLIPLMQGLRALYTQRGDWARWRRLVEEVDSAFVALDGHAHDSDRHQEWAIVLGYLVDIEAATRNWPEVERLARLLVDGERNHAAPILTIPVDELSELDRHRLAMLANALDKLGSARRELQHEDCLTLLQEAYDLADRVGDRAGMAITASNIAGCFTQVASIRDLDLAEEWYLRSLALHSPTNLLTRAACFGGLGAVAVMRFQAGVEAKKPPAERLRFLLEAHQNYSDVLAILPSDAIYPLATTHAQLGAVCGWLASHFNFGDDDEAMHHYRRAMDYFRILGDSIAVTGLQFNAAIFLFSMERWREALAYAEAAHEAMASQGELSTENTEFLKGLIAEIAQRLADDEE